MSFVNSLGALAILLVGLFLVCLPFKYGIAKLRLQTADMCEISGSPWKLPFHGVLYTLAGVCVTALVCHIQHWPVAIVASGVLILGATLAPGLDWSRDSKLKRFAYCAINFALGAAIGAILIPIVPDITWI